MAWYNHVKIAIPETIEQNKIIILGQYISKLEKVKLFCSREKLFGFIADNSQDGLEIEMIQMYITNELK